jgi:hypothetical protein
LFGHRYYGSRHFGPHYFGDGGDVVVAPPAPEPVVTDARGQFAEHPLKPWIPPEPRKGATRFTEQGYLIPERAIAAGLAWAKLEAIAAERPSAVLAGAELAAILAQLQEMDPDGPRARVKVGARSELVNFDRLIADVSRLHAEAVEREELELLGLI